MRHWTQEPTTENPGVAAAETFAKYFVVEDAEGSILRDDLYHAYVRWASQRGHEVVPERPFLEAVTDHVQVETSAMTSTTSGSSDSTASASRSSTPSE